MQDFKIGDRVAYVWDKKPVGIVVSGPKEYPYLKTVMVRQHSDDQIREWPMWNLVLDEDPFDKWVRETRHAAGLD